uniref:Uncharacterized protein n=1 Tax=Zea mays TaxID=4577 RepID=A0A804PT72_MAIZE
MRHDGARPTDSLRVGTSWSVVELSAGKHPRRAAQRRNSARREVSQRAPVSRGCRLQQIPGRGHRRWSREGTMQGRTQGNAVEQGPRLGKKLHGELEGEERNGWASSSRRGKSAGCSAMGGREERHGASRLEEREARWPGSRRCRGWRGRRSRAHALGGDGAERLRSGASSHGRAEIRLGGRRWDGAWDVRDQGAAAGGRCENERLLPCEEER